MPYNPRIHQRRSIRLKGYGYLKAGLYQPFGDRCFVTIYCQDRVCLFEEIVHTISNYIINNPAKWEDDKFYQQ